MKKILLILLCLPMIGFGQKTFVPDDDFEQFLINEGYDNVLDDSVQTSAIDTISTLYIGFFISNISDLTGLEDFTLLKTLTIGANLNLTSLDVSQNTLLEYLNCSGNNIASLDISANLALNYLDCSYNQLTSLDLRNGNNVNMDINLFSNPLLNCIDVDNVNWSNSNWTMMSIDAHHYFSNDCNTINDIYDASKNNKLIQVIDVFGRQQIHAELNLLMFHIYENGVIHKNIIIKSY